jgi:hypothetical protein
MGCRLRRRAVRRRNHLGCPVVGTLPWTGHRTGREQVPDYFKTMWSFIVPEQTRIVLDILLIDGEDAMQLGTFSHVTRLGQRAFTQCMHLEEGH